MNEADDYFKDYKILMNKFWDLLEATLDKNINEICKIIKEVHMDNIALKYFYNHIALGFVIFYAYFKAQNSYQIEQENETELGVADFIFYPKFDTTRPAIIIELKINDSTYIKKKDLKFLINYKIW